MDRCASGCEILEHLENRSKCLRSDQQAAKDLVDGRIVRLSEAISLTTTPRIESKGLSTAGEGCRHMNCVVEIGLVAGDLKGFAHEVTFGSSEGRHASWRWWKIRRMTS